jgi:hypothetical protein
MRLRSDIPRAACRAFKPGGEILELDIILDRSARHHNPDSAKLLVKPRNPILAAYRLQAERHAIPLILRALSSLALASQQLTTPNARSDASLWCQISLAELESGRGTRSKCS